MSILCDITTLEQCPLPDLQRKILASEFAVSHIQPDAHARIVWNNLSSPSPTPTEFALVYLHGFTANHLEGHPLHINIAHHFGMNAYLSRFDKHGTTAEDFKQLTCRGLIESARKALAIGRRIGKRVILMGSSTGASLSLYLAARHKEVAGLILYSPLVDFYDWRVRALTYSPLNNAASKLAGSTYWIDKRDSIDANQKIWYNYYPLNGVLELAKFVQQYMIHSEFAKITQPIFTGYYYKNRAEKDNVVSVKAIRSMVAHVSTPRGQNIHQAFPNAGSHVINSPLTSGCLPELYMRTKKFVSDTVGVKR